MIWEKRRLAFQLRHRRQTVDRLSLERLDAGVVVAVERRDRVRAARRFGIVRRVEPDTDVEGMHRIGGRVAAGVGEGRVIVDQRRRLDVGGDMVVNRWAGLAAERVRKAYTPSGRSDKRDRGISTDGGG